MPNRNCLILVALTQEAKALTEVLPKDYAPTIIGVRACRLAPDMLRKNPRIILAGLGGALDPALKIGDVIVSHDKTATWPKLPYRMGAIHTSDHLVDAKEKTELFRTTGALAVDMESAIVRAAAEDVGVSLLTIRAISDTAGDSLPQNLLDLVDELGNPRPAKLAKAMMFQPALMTALHRLGKNSQVALKNLCEAVGAVIDKLETK